MLARFAAFVAYMVVSVIAVVFGLGFIGTLAGLVGAVAAFFLVKGKGGAGGAGGASSYPAGFEPSFAHDNIAIDQANGKLWLRDRSGFSAVVDKGDVLRWNRAYVSRGTIEFNNKLEVHVRDLNRPKFEVAFNRHGDTWKSGAARNSQEAEEWASRLTTWCN